MKDKLDVGQICNRQVVFIHRHMSVSEAARLMRAQHVGSLVVVEESDDGHVVVGMLTDRDIAIAVVARDFNAQTMRVADVMSTTLVTVRPEDAISTTLDLMRRHGVRRVPVTNEQDVLIGIVTLDDLLDVVAEELRTLVQTIMSEHKREVHIRG